MSHRLTFFTLPTARAVPLLCWVVVVFVCCLCLVPVFCMCRRHLFDLNCGFIQMTDNA